MKAFVLAGGEGKRLHPLTQRCAKPALLIGDRPLIDFTLHSLTISGITEVYVFTQYLAETLTPYLKNVHILKSKTRYSGTADAIRQHPELLEEGADFLILPADHIYEMNFNALRKVEGDVVIATSFVKEAHQFGIVETRNQQIIRFQEKPASLPPGHYQASMGIYLFQKKALQEALKWSGNDFGHDLFPHLIEKFRVMAYPFQGYWKDVGTLEALNEISFSDIAL